MKKYLFTLLLLGAVVCAPAAQARAAEIVELSLLTAQRDALNYSPQLKQMRAQAQAAQQEAKSVGAVYYPSLYLDAKGTWASHVPQLSLGALEVELGDNWGYSVGPTVEYALFDYGGKSGAHKSAKHAHAAAVEEFNFAQKNIILSLRQAYFTVQHNLESMYFMSEQLKVAQKQLSDVNAAFKAGAKSSLDVSMAQKQQLGAQIGLSNARAALGISLRQLFRLTGTDYGIDANYPADWRVQLNEGQPAATAVIKADGLNDTLDYMAPLAALNFDESSPRLLALDNMAKYYEYYAEGLRSSLYPTVVVAGGAYWE